MSTRAAHPSPPDDDGTGRDRVPDVLAGLRHGVAAPTPGSAAAARRTAARRQGTRLAGAGLAVAALMVGVPFGVSFGSPEAAPVPLATQEQDPTAPAEDGTTSPAPSVAPPSLAPPSVLPSAPPSATPRPDTGPEATPDVTVEPGPPVEPSTGPPVTPLQVEPSDTGGVSAGELAGEDLGIADVELVDAGSGAATWALDPCQPTSWPLDAARTGWASVHWWVGDAGGTREAATYATEAEAVEQLDAFRRVASACWGSPGDVTARWVWQETSPPGETAAVFAGLQREVYVGEQEEQWAARDGTFWVALREGRTVVLASTAEHYAGGVIAVYQGDTREGTGAGVVAEGTTPEQAAESVRERLSGTRAVAQEMLDDLAR